MIVIEEKLAEHPVSVSEGNANREEIIRASKAHLHAIKAGRMLESSGIPLTTVAHFAQASTAEFETFFSTLALEQAVLLRDFLKKLLELAEATDEGEVVLSTVASDTIKLVLTDSGLISFLHDSLEVIICVKKLEANATAKHFQNKPNFAEKLRRFKQQVEQGAGEVAGRFVA